MDNVGIVVDDLKSAIASFVELGFETRPPGKGSNGFLGQIGQFETANGIPHGPAAIALAIVVAILVVPVRRLVRYVTSR